MDKKRKGDLGEDYICAELIKRGHTIICRNFRIAGGEIDIISQVGRFIVFTEVKTRQLGSMVSGLCAVTASKQRRIVKTADFYLWNIYAQSGAELLQPRYDIAEVTITRGEAPLVVGAQIYEDAFTADGLYTIY